MRGNRERPESGIYFEIFEKNTIFNKHPEELTDIITRLASWSGIQYNFMIIIPSAFLLCLNFEIVNDCVGEQLVARRLHLWCFFSYSHKKNYFPDQLLLRGTVSRVADPDPVGSGVFAWIRIRYLDFSGSGSGFKISLDLDPVSAQMEQKKLQKGLIINSS